MRNDGHPFARGNIRRCPKLHLDGPFCRRYCRRLRRDIGRDAVVHTERGHRREFALLVARTEVQGVWTTTDSGEKPSKATQAVMKAGNMHAVER
jgi:hypothetical protein